MASQVLTNTKVWVDQYDVSGQLNAVAVEYGVDALDETTFGDDTRTNTAGLKTTTMSHEGYWAAGTDEAIFNSIGNGSTVVTIAGAGSAVGDDAYLAQTLSTTYSPGAAVGELLAFTVDMEAAGPLVRGALLANNTASGNGNAAPVQLGAVAASEKIFGALHVTSIAGGTLTVKIQSDSASGFGSPTDQITFTAATGLTAQFSSATGAVTDTYWRALWTLTGGSASFIVSAGIGE